MNNNYKHATFAGGCFWCTEALFSRVSGVLNVVPGYTGGTVKNPTYEEVCNGRTGHAEAVQITFDPIIVSYDELLNIFWNIHDPTTLNQQGNDVGTQYRSAIYYHDEEQKRIAETSKEKLDESGKYSKPAVTEIVALGEFYVAEEYHQDFYARNPNHPYCRYVIAEKLGKV